MLFPVAHGGDGDAQVDLRSTSSGGELGLRPVYDSAWLSLVLARMALPPAFAGASWPEATRPLAVSPLAKAMASARPPAILSNALLIWGRCNQRAVSACLA